MLESVLQEKEKLVEELERVKQEKSQSAEKYKDALKTLQESYEKWVYFIALYSFSFVCVERLDVHSRRPTLCLSHIQTCALSTWCPSFFLCLDPCNVHVHACL